MRQLKSSVYKAVALLHTLGNDFTTSLSYETEIWIMTRLRSTTLVINSYPAGKDGGGGGTLIKVGTHDGWLASNPNNVGAERHAQLEWRDKPPR